MIFKNKEDHFRFAKLHPVALRVMATMCEFCFFRKMPFVVTSTVTTIAEDIELGRRSSTHRTGRAFDLSIKDWTEDQVAFFVNYFNDKFRDVAAVNGDLKAVLIPDINHGTAPHIHVQIHSRFALESPLETEAEK
jgi:hypothetical protein